MFLTVEKEDETGNNKTDFKSIIKRDKYRTFKSIIRQLTYRQATDLQTEKQKD